jgi:putative proteasome-type protease
MSILRHLNLREFFGGDAERGAAMTYCLGIRVAEGLVCITDGRLTAGAQVSAARKASRHGRPGAEFHVMCSGLRSLRDRTLTYFDHWFGAAAKTPEGAPSDAVTPARLVEAVEQLSRCVKHVIEDDRDNLERSGLHADLHMIVAGQLGGDAEPGLYLIYPEGNWVSVDARLPYLAIGAVAYGKAVLDRTVQADTPMRIALKAAYLAFESTRLASADVGYPIDVLTFGRDRIWREREFDHDDLLMLRRWWDKSLVALVETMPEALWQEGLLPGPTWSPRAEGPTQLAASQEQSKRPK